METIQGCKTRLQFMVFFKILASTYEPGPYAPRTINNLGEYFKSHMLQDHIHSKIHQMAGSQYVALTLQLIMW